MDRKSRRFKRLTVFTVSLLILITLDACNDDEHGNSFVWSPLIIVQKQDAHATLLLSDPRPYTEYTHPPMSPDYFEIYVSEDNINFSMLKKVDSDVTELPVESLTNGKAYYFFVEAVKTGVATQRTDTIMTIPSKEFATELYLPEADGSFERLATSFDKNYISYISGSDLYYREMGSTAGHYVATNVNGGSWAKNENRYAYVTTIVVGSVQYQNELRLLTTEGGQSTTLLRIDYQNYSLQSPEFSPNANELTFFSNESATDQRYSDLWKMDLATLQRQRITDFQSKGFHTGGEYDWPENTDEVYLAGHYNIQKHESDIYKVNILSGAITPVIVSSQWYESRPALSPDNNRIAFTSDASGRSELWIYDIAGSSSVQVTPIEGFFFDERSSELQWLNDHEILITAYDNTKSVPVKIKLD